MERIFLCLLCLSGWSVSSFLPRQYHYVKDRMTWTEAQTYCREKYTDLATVESPEEMEQLKSSVPSDHYSGHVWIGPYSNIQWKWSDGYTGSGSDYRNWENIEHNQPDFDFGDQLCVIIDFAGLWRNDGCLQEQESICYNGTQQDPKYVYVSDRLSWSDAQSNCRENYVDLATVKSETENQKIQDLLSNRDWPFAWIGLYRGPDVFWSDGSGYTFQFWHESSDPLDSMSAWCGAANLQDSGKWNLKACDHRLPFVCYSTGSGSRQVIKLKMKADDSVDLNDPAVKAALLTQLQDQMKESGLSGVTLKWREQPDGKVFHKEEESSQQNEKQKEKCEL